MKALLLLAALLVGWSVESHARPCIPIYGPTTIHTPGRYCLANHMYGAPVGVVIAAHDVELDLQRKTINCERRPFSQGVRVEPGMSSVTVRNGTILSCSWGLNGWGKVGSHFLAQDLYIVDSDLRALQVWGADYVTVERVTAERTGPSRVPWWTQRVIGLEAAGRDVVMTEVQVEDTVAPGPTPLADSAAISCTQGSRCKLVRPIITSVGPGEPHEFGLWVGGGVQATVISPVIDGYCRQRALYASTGTHIRALDAGALEVTIGDVGEVCPLPDLDAGLPGG